MSDPASDQVLLSLYDQQATIKRLYSMTPETIEYRELRVAYFASLARFHREIQQRLRGQ